MLKILIALNIKVILVSNARIGTVTTKTIKCVTFKNVLLVAMYLSMTIVVRNAKRATDFIL